MIDFLTAALFVVTFYLAAKFILMEFEK